MNINTQSKPARSALIFRVLALIISTAGVIAHLLEQHTADTEFMIRHKLAYFTIQTNIMIILLFAVLLFKALKSWRSTGRLPVACVSPGLHLCLVLYISITMLGFWLILVPTTGISKEPFIFWNSMTLHAITPLLAILDHILFADHGKVPRKDVFKWLIYPFAYLIFVMIVSQFIQEPYYSFRMNGKTVALMYPYPFLDPAVMGTWGVVGAVLGLTVLFLLLGLLYIKIDSLLSRLKRNRVTSSL